MSRKKRKRTYTLFIVVVLCITIGYAYLYTQLTINGTSKISKASWSVYWDNIQFGANNITNVTIPATIQTGKTAIVFKIRLHEPGDTYEFTVDAKNDGSVNAMVNVVSSGVYASNGTTPRNLPDYLEYTITYSDGLPIAQNHLLASNSSERYKVRVHYKEDTTAAQLPSTNDVYVFKFNITYVQADSNAIAVTHPLSFADDDWGTIINAVQSGNISNYHVGDTKTVNISGLGTYKLRIANTTTPAECSTTGYSQTACGFVLEFEDIISKHAMNISSATTSWPTSSMRAYVNNSIYNSLPATLRSAIIDTYVVSGHGNGAGETNYTSTDKLYLLSAKEVYGHNNYSQYDTARDYTRQLDYYANLNVDDNNTSPAGKKYNNEVAYWWLRTRPSYDDYSYLFLLSDGRPNYEMVVTPPTGSHIGCSPAFRIG